MQTIPEFSFYFTSSIYIFWFHRQRHCILIYSLICLTLRFLELLWNKLQYLCPSKYTLHTTNYIMSLLMSTSHQKLYTEFPFCLWWDVINSRFKSHLDNKSKKRFYNQRVSESKCGGKKTIDKDILINLRNTII